MKGHSWLIRTISGTALIVGAIALLTYVVDPYFHFHKPTENISYRIYDERFVNDGILRNFEYDSVIIGTSMTQNFKTTEFENLFGGTAVKTPLAGAGFQEISNTLERAFEYNPDIKKVLWGIDYGYLMQPYDYSPYIDFPEYLYDDNVLNDVNYLLNKDVLLHQTLYCLIATMQGKETTTFDEYASWIKPVGANVILKDYNTIENTVINKGLTETERQQVKETINKNIIKVVQSHPDTTFYMFYTPYSIVYWDREKTNGNMVKQLEADEIATELLVKCENIKLYSFFLNENLVTKLENYTDIGHYASCVNTYILEQMKGEEYLITEDNWETYIKALKEYYTEYDYYKFIQENKEGEK